MRPVEVCCAVIVRNRQVLATRRSASMPHPFRWEFPGGKIRQGETPAQCITREIREELGISVTAERQLSPVLHRYAGHTVTLIPLICSAGEEKIVLAEHDRYRWVSCSELDLLDWLEADREVVEQVRDALCP
jgi:8-oxo-dGTP diphosphatase